MSANEERRVKARHDVTQFYQRKKDVSRKEMSRWVMTISGDPNLDNSSSNSDDDIENDTYVPSPRAHPHRKELASASGSRTGRDDKIEEEAEEGVDSDDGEGKEEVFDVGMTMWALAASALTMVAWLEYPHLTLLLLTPLLR
jgi:hypothetical protein